MAKILEPKNLNYNKNKTFYSEKNNPESLVSNLELIDDCTNITYDLNSLIQISEKY